MNPRHRVRANAPSQDYSAWGNAPGSINVMNASAEGANHFWQGFIGLTLNRAFSAGGTPFHILGRLPQANLMTRRWR